MKYLPILTLTLLVQIAAHALTVSGYVFVDKNKNGKQDADEVGISKVAVSNQMNVVSTNNEGFYSLNGEGFGIIMISLPEGFSTSSFWQPVEMEGENVQINFPVTASMSITSFTFVHASDTHISEASLERMKKFKSAVDQVRPNFTIVTGDLVKDALRVPEEEATRYYELYKKEISNFGTVWNVPGNHENFGIERHLSLVSKKNPLFGRKMYRHYLGPDYYSFNYGGVHFIALNDIDFEDLFYFGRVDSTQVQWLKQDVALVPTSTPIVTFHHMAMFSPGMTLFPFKEYGLDRAVEWQNGTLQYRHVVSNALEIMTVLKDHNYVLSLAGHFHMRQLCRFEFKGKQTRFEQASSVIGSSEIGPYEVPSGITVYTVKNGVIDEGKFIDIDK